MKVLLSNIIFFVILSLSQISYASERMEEVNLTFKEIRSIIDLVEGFEKRPQTIVSIVAYEGSTVVVTLGTIYVHFDDKNVAGHRGGGGLVLYLKKIDGKWTMVGSRDFLA